MFKEMVSPTDLYDFIILKCLEDHNTTLKQGIFKWFKSKINLFYNAYLNLEDNYSKDIYIQILIKRLRHNHNYSYVNLDNSNKHTSNILQAKVLGNSENNNGTNNPRKLKIIEFLVNNNIFKIEYYNELTAYKRKQYLYDRDNLKIYPQLNDYVIDGGSFIGDSSLVFSGLVGEKGKVYCFEVLKENIDILERNIANHPLKNITVFKCGLSNQHVEAPLFSSENTYTNPGFKCHNKVVPLQTIDNLVSLEEINRVNYIKLDIEGFEVEALEGAYNTIKNYEPNMAVCLYHKFSDLFSIILYIKQNFPFYKMRINQHADTIGETVLYCYT